MTIEFRCVNCNKLLRVKDESAGKKAKCPQCATVLEIPLPGAPPEDDEFELEQPAPSPFPNFAAERPGERPIISANPYQSPAAVDTGVDTGQLQALDGPIVPTRISIVATFNRAWTIFTEHAGVVIGAMFIAAVIGFVAVFGLMFAIGGQMLAAGGMPNWPVFIVIYLVIIGLQLYLGCGEGIVVLNAARQRGPTISDLFKGAPYCLTVFLASLLAYLAVALGSGLVYLPFALIASLIGGPVAIVISVVAVAFIAVSVVILMLMFSQFVWLILDKKLGPIKCFVVSQNITSGNKLTLFVLLFLAGFLPFVVILAIATITNLIGIPFLGSLILFAFQVLYMAYALILFATAYLMMTGQISERG